MVAHRGSVWYPARVGPCTRGHVVASPRTRTGSRGDHRELRAGSWCWHSHNFLSGVQTAQLASASRTAPPEPLGPDGPPTHPPIELEFTTWQPTSPRAGRAIPWSADERTALRANTVVRRSGSPAVEDRVGAEYGAGWSCGRSRGKAAAVPVAVGRGSVVTPTQRSEVGLAGLAGWPAPVDRGVGVDVVEVAEPGIVGGSRGTTSDGRAGGPGRPSARVGRGRRPRRGDAGRAPV